MKTIVEKSRLDRVLLVMYTRAEFASKQLTGVYRIHSGNCCIQKDHLIDSTAKVTNQGGTRCRIHRV